MDKTIHRHLDLVDDLLEKVQKDIDKLYEGLSLKDILEDPETVLLEFSEEVAAFVIQKYGDDFVRLGIDFAEAVKKKRTPIEVPNA